MANRHGGPTYRLGDGSGMLFQHAYMQFWGYAETNSGMCMSDGYKWDTGYS